MKTQNIKHYEVKFTNRTIHLIEAFNYTMALKDAERLADFYNEYVLSVKLYE